jgi:hypothetical protein
MALKLRRGTDLQRQQITPQEGELLYTTDTKKLYVGDGSQAGGNKVAPVTTADIAEDSGYKFYTTERAQDDAAGMFTTSTTVSTTHVGITFAYNDSQGKIVATVPDKGTVLSAQAGEIATYNTAGTTISGTTGLNWDNNIRQLALSNSSVSVTASTGNRSLITFETSAPGSIGNNISFLRSRGTQVSPTSVQALDTMGGIAFSGHDGAEFITGASVFTYVPTGFPVSTGVVPTALNVNLMDTAGINTTRLRVFPDGKTILGPFSGTETGGGFLNINSTVPVQAGILNPMLGIKAFLETTNSQRMTMARYRGTPANPTKLEATDVIFNLTFFGYDGVSATYSSQIQGAVDGPVSTGKVPGVLRFATTNANGANTTWLTLNKDGILSHIGAFNHTGVKTIAPNYATISTSSTVSLSASTTNNVLLVGNSGLTVTLNMPTPPADGQLCEFIVHSNNTTLAMGTGTVIPAFAGAVTFGTSFKYVYRASNTTWYKLG